MSPKVAITQKGAVILPYLLPIINLTKDKLKT